MLLAAVLVLMLSSMASAVVENKQVGPYAVSFNMNTNMKLNPPQMQEPIVAPLATSYYMEISTDNNTRVGITITEYKSLTDSTIQMYKNLVGLSMTLRGINVTTVEDKVIDDKKGLLASGLPFPGPNAPTETKFYQATYWLDSKDCECGPVSVGTTRVDVTSSYPEDVTMSLLDSIKVEKTGQTEQNVSTQDMPPASS